MAVDHSKYKNSKSTHWISNSGHDENGAYHGGQAGDQTSQEWELKKWYNRPWTCVLRHPDKTIADMIADYAIDAALNAYIGYDQYERTSYWSALKSSGYDPANVRIKCEADCTAGVTANVKAIGYKLGITKLKNLSTGIYSGNMKAKFKAAGFEVLTDKKYLNGYSYLEPGDILLYEGHHAATNITRGKNAKKTEETTTVPVVEEYTVAGTWYVRTEPNKKGAVVTIVGNGAKVGYLGESKDGWMYVTHGDKVGWISERAIKRFKAVTYKVKKGNWYVRTNPIATAKPVAVAQGGDTVKTVDDNTIGGWLHVEYKGQTGYISEKAIEK